MSLSESYSKKLIFSTFIFLGAALLFFTKPIFAQTSSLPATTTGQGQIGQAGELGTANDFDDDVKQGKDELQKDPAAQRHQKEVIDGEDEQAGDEEDQDINEHTDIHEAEISQGENEENEDINNSEVEEVDDTDDLDEESQEVINEHQDQEDGEVENEQQNGKETPEKETSGQEQNSNQ